MKCKYCDFKSDCLDCENYIQMKLKDRDPDEQINDENDSEISGLFDCLILDDSCEFDNIDDWLLPEAIYSYRDGEFYWGEISYNRFTESKEMKFTFARSYKLEDYLANDKWWKYLECESDYYYDCKWEDGECDLEENSDEDELNNFIGKGELK